MPQAVPADSSGWCYAGRSRADRLKRLSWQSVPELKTLTFLLAVAGFLAFMPTAAEAQLYTWHDANGHLVISDKPGGSNQRTYPVVKAGAVRTTRAPVSNYRNQFEDLILTNANRYGVRADLVRAVIQAESAFNPKARSPKGAQGLMQLMPATARELGVKKPFDPVQNIKGGVAYLKQLLDRYDNNEELALAAYNAGPGAVERYGNTVPPFRETQDYVSRIRGTSVSAVSGSRTSGGGGSVEGRSGSVSTPSRRAIYKTVEMVDGRLVPKYTNDKPSSGNYEVVAVGR